MVQCGHWAREKVAIVRADVAQQQSMPRKSTEHNLDLEFNSLDAQREACEAYIKIRPMRAGGLFRAISMTGAYRAPPWTARPSMP